MSAQHPEGHVVLNAPKGLVEDHVIKTFVYQHVHVMYQCVIYGQLVAVVAEVGVTMCVDVNIFMKTIPRHAKSCKGKVQKTDGLSQRPASTVGFKSSGHDGPLCRSVCNIIPFVMMHDFVPS